MYCPAGLLVLGLLSQCMPEAFKPQVPALVSGLGVCLSHAVRDVQLAALRASSLFIQVRVCVHVCVCVCMCDVQLAAMRASLMFIQVLACTCWGEGG